MALELRYEGSEAQSAWVTTFSDLVFLLLTFFVLQYATTVPKVRNEAPVSSEQFDSPPVVQAAGEVNVIYGAFSPSDSDQLSFRGRTAVVSLARQAIQLGRDLRVSLTLGSYGNYAPDDAFSVLHRQRMSVLRQLSLAGLPEHAVVLTPLSPAISDKSGDSKAANSLTSRLEITVQEKRS